MKVDDLLGWVQSHEQQGHQVCPTDNPRDKTRGACCLTCNEWVDGPAELSPEIRAWRQGFREKIAERARSAGRPVPALFDDDFSMTANYFS
jgi:hypothetical protein